MFKRLVAMAVSAGAMASLLVVGSTATPALAEPVPLSLSMVANTGELQIRDAEEAYPLKSPTTYVGTIDGGDTGTGAITGAAFATPDISFQVPVLDGALMADVDAHFAEIAPGTSTGTVSPEGVVTLRTSLRVDLHIVVPQAAVDANCTASPVNLELISTAPYDDVTERVTVRDPSFSIPSFPTTADCPGLVTDNMNPLLAGPGHTLELTLDGPIDVPPVPGSLSTTTLTASPEGSSGFGDDVTFRAEIASGDAGNTAVPTGLVEFFADGDPLGNVALTDGVAELVTGDLTAGPHTITAEYGGDSEFQVSDDEIPYTVEAVPGVDFDLPPTVVVSEAAQVFNMTVENPTSGTSINNAAVDITFTRPAGGLFRPGMVVVERRVSGDTWEEVPMTAISTSVMGGRIGPDVGRPLAAPGSIVDDLRIKANPTGSGVNTPLGAVTVAVDLKQVDPTTGTAIETLNTSSGSIIVAQAGRVPTTFVIDEGSYGPALSPSVVRAGNSVTVNSWGFDTGGIPATGTVSALLDGVPISFWHRNLTVDAPKVMSMAPMTDMIIDTPAALPSGQHTISVLYSGDDVLAPASHSVTFTVVNQRDPLYDCGLDALPAHRFRAQVRAFARLPASAPADSEFPLRNLDVEFVTDRSFGFWNLIQDLLPETPVTVGDTLDSIEFEFGSATATATSATRFGIFHFDPSDLDPDMRFTFDGEAGTMSVTGLPGDAVPVDLDRLDIVGRGSFGSQFAVSCVPVADPVRLGTVIVAGTTLAVEAAQPTRANDLVRMRATVAPSNATGQVEFLDGDEVVAVAPVVAGQAVANTALAVGTHELIARFRAGASAPSTTSAPTEIDVLPSVDCADFADPGKGAVVRLVYMELLGRCPDPAGYAYWKAKLEAGTSATAFARAIAYTPEALDQVVIDAYRTVLDRDPSTADKKFWRGRLSRNGGYFRLLSELSASDEFWVASGRTRAGFVTRVYERLLGRSPDAAGLDYWVGELLKGGQRNVVMFSLARLREPVRVIVVDAYDEILGRAPNAVELDAAVRALQGTGDRSALYAQLIGLPEFEIRAQTLPNPED